MMSDYKHNNHFTSEDIRKYLAGKLSPAEMHAMEKAALEDPFLADAIEGISTGIEEEGEFKVGSELEILKKEFSSKYITAAKERVTPIRRLQWWKPVAAAAVLLVGAFTAYSLLITNNSEKSVAVVQADEKAESVLNELKVNDSIAPDSNVAKQQKAPPKEPDDAAVASSKLSQRPTSGSPTITPAPAKTNTEKEEAPSPALSKPNDIALSRKKEEVAKAKDNAEQEAKKSEDQQNVAGLADMNQKPEIKRDLPVANNMFSGFVTDQNKKPLASAVVQIQNSDKAYITDKNGAFTIPSADTSLNVLIGSIGFEPQQLKLSNSIPGASVALQPSVTSLNEVVVVGYGSKKNRAASSGSREAIVQDAEPAGGRLAFEKYVEQNKKLTSLDSSIEVVVSFNVNKNGKLSEFKVEEGASAEYNAEAIRLVREGPTWKLFKGRKTRATVMIRF